MASSDKKVGRTFYDLIVELKKPVLLVLVIVVLLMVILIETGTTVKIGSLEIGNRQALHDTTIITVHDTIHNQSNLEKKITVSLLDTKTNSERIDSLLKRLYDFSFIETNGFTHPGLEQEDIKRKPDILIAHWHAYRIGSVNKKDDLLAEKKFIETLADYRKENPNMEVIVFSAEFNNQVSVDDFFSQIGKSSIQNKSIGIHTYYLDRPDSTNNVNAFKNEVLVIEGKVVSIALQRFEASKQ